MTLPPVELPRGFEDLRGRVFVERYQCSEVLSVGRSHVVFGATDRKRKTEVLLRLMRPGIPRDRATIERFTQRSQNARRASHPRARPSIDAGEGPDGNLYFVCERPPGNALSQCVAEHEHGRLPWPLARGALQSMVEVLKVAHIRRIVHGRMTPDSFWIEERDGSPLLAYLVDLGASHELGFEDDTAEPIRTTAHTADAAFLAPEAIDTARVDQRTDVYHLGLLTYFMLVGRPPFQGENHFLLAMQQARDPVPPMRDAVPEIPEAVETLVGNMLAKDPGARPQTLTKLERALGAIRGEVAVVRARSKGEPSKSSPSGLASLQAGQSGERQASNEPSPPAPLRQVRESSPGPAQAVAVMPSHPSLGLADDSFPHFEGVPYEPMVEAIQVEELGLVAWPNVHASPRTADPPGVLRFDEEPLPVPANGASETPAPLSSAPTLSPMTAQAHVETTAVLQAGSAVPPALVESAVVVTAVLSATVARSSVPVEPAPEATAVLSVAVLSPPTPPQVRYEATTVLETSAVASLVVGGASDRTEAVDRGELRLVVGSQGAQQRAPTQASIEVSSVHQSDVHGPAVGIGPPSDPPATAGGHEREILSHAAKTSQDEPVGKALERTRAPVLPSTWIVVACGITVVAGIAAGALLAQ